MVVLLPWMVGLFVVGRPFTFGGLALLAVVWLLYWRLALFAFGWPLYRGLTPTLRAVPASVSVAFIIQSTRYKAITLYI